MTAQLNRFRDLISAALSRSGVMLVPEVERVIAEDIERVQANAAVIRPPIVGDRMPSVDLIDQEGYTLAFDTLCSHGEVIVILEGGLVDTHRDAESAAAYRLAERYPDKSILLITPHLRAHDLPLLRRQPGNLRIVEDAERRLGRCLRLTLPLPSGLQWALERVGASVFAVDESPTALLQLSARFIIDRNGLIRYSSASFEPLSRPVEDDIDRVLIRLSTPLAGVSAPPERDMALPA